MNSSNSIEVISVGIFLLQGIATTLTPVHSLKVRVSARRAL